MGSVLGTILVVGILICVIGLAIFSMIQDKKNGKSLQCGCDCKKCGGHCHNGQGR
ncbi:MAG: FeoB-associated Cys-rich membrane protein [Lachnospiraceae bacterium]|nr:FeoB-associated Cys-rich membrane protein [Lachnospiraceae bacterium]